MDERQRNHFTRILLESRGLSECQEALSVIICGREELIVAEVIKKYDPQSPISQTTPLYTALQKYHKIGRCSDAYIFFSYFPSPLEIEMIVFSKILKFYFIGEIDNPETVKYLDKIQTAGIPMEVGRVNIPYL